MTQHNNLVTRISELEAELAKAKKSLRDEFAMAVSPSLIPYNLIGSRAPKEIAIFVARLSYEYADLMLAERERR